MKKTFLYVLLGVLSSATVYAKSEGVFDHCPAVDDVVITKVQKPWTHYYSAYNKDQKYFVSKEYTEDEHNGPAPVIEFDAYLSKYDKASKTLTCVYYAFTRVENSHPELVNVGDY